MRCSVGVLAVFIIGCRNFNYFKHYKLVKNGIDEAGYIMLGGQEQYILIRGENVHNPVIIYLHGGHSYGTILGSVYAHKYPKKVDTYIGAAQVISLEETDMYSYRDALSKAQAAGEDISELENAYEQYANEKSLKNLMHLRNKVYQYHPVEISDKATWMAVISPYFGVDDLRWFLVQLGDMEEYVKLNKQLFDFTFDFNIYDYGLD